VLAKIESTRLSSLKEDEPARLDAALEDDALPGYFATNLPTRSGRGVD
jgi:hypothetical protein